MLIVISFNSLEDRVVKYFFKTYSDENKNPSRYLPKIIKKDLRLFNRPIKKVIFPSDKEILENHPSRSAKLRFVIRNGKKFFYPNEFVEKFKSYLEIERLEACL